LNKSDILLVVFSPDRAETNVWWGGNLNGHLMASCVRNIRTKSYQNLIIRFQVTVTNVGDALLKHKCICICVWHHYSIIAHVPVQKDKMLLCTRILKTHILLRRQHL